MEAFCIYDIDFHIFDIQNFKNMKENQEINVKMVDTGKATRNYHQTILNFGSLGREVKISPKANVTINKEGYKQEFFVESVSVLIGIGNDHTADLIMSRDS